MISRGVVHVHERGDRERTCVWSENGANGLCGVVLENHENIPVLYVRLASFTGLGIF